MPLAVVSREPWWYRRAMVLFIMAVAVMPFVPASRRSPRGMTRSIRLATLFLSLAWAAQSGVEAGVDLLVGRVLGFHVTRFDQLAAGLIRPVAVSSSGPGPGGDGGGGGGGRGGSGPGGGGPNDGRRIAYELQNVGEITNRGWEVSGSAGAHGFTVSTAYAIVDSRVRRLLSLVATADNLLNHEFGEPDNVTVLPGRTIAGGLRARF
jgi:hypothetical protein